MKKTSLSPDEKISVFDKLLKEFVQTYNIGMKGKEDFAQCGPTVFQPTQDLKK